MGAVVADRVVVELQAQNDNYNREMKRSADQHERNMRDIVRSTDQMEHAVGKDLDALGKRWRDLGTDIGRGVADASRKAQLALAGIVGYSIKLAADAQEIENAFSVAFGAAADGAREFSEALAATAGRDAVTLRKDMSQLQLVLTGVGLEAKTAATLVQSLTARSVDIGSLFNVSDAQAMAAVISGITGEAEPLKRFGVALNEAAVKAELLRLGFKGNAENASEAAKAIARANIIIKQTAVAQGDAANTADSAANKAKAMTAEFNKAARELGEQLLPAFVKAAGAATDLLKAFNDLPGGLQLAGLGILAFVAAAGPVGALLANLGKVLKLARDTRLALMGLTGASAAAGGAGLAGGLAGAAGAAAPFVGVAALPFLGGDTQQQRKNLDYQGQLNELLKTEAGLRATAAEQAKRGQDRNAAATRAEADKFKARIDALRKSDPIGAPVSGAEVRAYLAGESDTSVVGGFSLTPDMMKGAGSGGKGRARAGQTSSLTQISPVEELFNSEDIARKILENAADEAEALRTATADAIIAGREDAAKSQESVAALNTFAAEMEKAQYDATFDGVRGALQALVDGDILQFFARSVGDALLNEASDALTQALMNAGGGGNLLASLGKAALSFIPGFATGTQYAQGGLARVHKDELIHLPRGSSVIPRSQSQAMLNQAGGGPIQVSINLAGANGDATIEAISRRAAAQGVRQALELSRRGAPGLQTRMNLLGTT